MNFFFLLLLLPICQTYLIHLPEPYHQKYLSKGQWEKIQRILQHPQLPPVKKEQLQTIIYNHYHKWAYYKAYQFKQLHRYKCHAITLHELAIYSQQGLYQAVEKYNGKNRFLPYATIYVMGELYRGMTELHPMTHFPPSIRRRKPITLFNHTLYVKDKSQRKTQFVGEDVWIWDKLSPVSSTTPSRDIFMRYLEKEKEQEQYQQIQRKIEELEPITQLIFSMKYGIPIREKEISNREIGEKIGYSEEFVRKKVQQIKNHFLPPFSPSSSHSHSL